MKLKINGQSREVDVLDPETPLLWVLRDALQMNGTKYGCGMGQCGACTVHLDGKAVRACLTPIGGVGAAEVTTIEGLARLTGKTGAVAGAVTQAWEAIDVPQCGYCQPGQIMSAVALLVTNPTPDAAEIDSAMTGNVCRCATYQRIRGAIQNAASGLKG